MPIKKIYVKKDKLHIERTNDAIRFILFFFFLFIFIFLFADKNKSISVASFGLFGYINNIALFIFLQFGDSALFDWVILNKKRRFNISN